MENVALTIFSIFIQAAIGLLVFITIANFLNKDSGVRKTAVLTAAGLAIIGLLASLLHLGRPLLALNSLAKFGTSWLSREIWFTGTFTGLTIIALLLLYYKPARKNTVRILILAASVVGLADVFMMASIYNFASVPAWQHSSVYVEFYAAALSIGAMLFLAFNRKEALNISNKAVTVVGIAVTLQVVAMVLYYIDLGANGSLAAHQSIALLCSMGGAVAAKWLFILVGAGLLFFPGRIQTNISVSAGSAEGEVAATEAITPDIRLYIAAGLLIIGQIVGRYLFYAIMIGTTVGLN